MWWNWNFLSNRWGTWGEMEGRGIGMPKDQLTLHLRFMSISRDASDRKMDGKKGQEDWWFLVWGMILPKGKKLGTKVQPFLIQLGDYGCKYQRKARILKTPKTNYNIGVKIISILFKVFINLYIVQFLFFFFFGKVHGSRLNFFFFFGWRSVFGSRLNFY